MTDPRTWGAAGWASDLLPHLAYGLATATVDERWPAGPADAPLR